MFYQEILLLFIIYVFPSHCQRRIVNGKNVTSDKAYMVYLRRSSSTKNTDLDNWLCGGAIVHPWYIISSYACLNDVKKAYVIAGLNYNVNLTELLAGGNECASNTKRKIIRVCAATENEHRDVILDNTDIALGKVDRPYGYTAEFKKFHCSYVPRKIGVNYFPKYQWMFRDVMALGWGSVGSAKPQHDIRFLKYTVGYLADVKKCEEMISDFDRMYYECFNEKGSLDDNGTLLDLDDGQEVNTGCLPDSKNYDYHSHRNLRRFTRLRSDQYRRFGGLCKYDNGGPLVGWIGGKEMVLGVASYFTVDKDEMCTGPSVFASTACIGQMLYCTLEQNKEAENGEEKAQANPVKVKSCKIDMIYALERHGFIDRFINVTENKRTKNKHKNIVAHWSITDSHNHKIK